MADTPATESVQEVKPPTTDEEAVDLVSRMMEPPGPPKEDEETESPEATREEPEESTSAEEEEVDASSEETETDEPVEETEETEVELPDTIDGLAKELGVSPEDLANHLKIAVTVNGQTREVTLSEARTGHQLDQDYRQKTMELADQRRSFEAERVQAHERWQQSVQRLEDAIAISEEMTGEPSREEMRRLMDEDPWQYQRISAQLTERREALNKMKAEREKVREEARAAAQKTQMEYRTRQQHLLVEKFPDIKSPEKLQAFERSAAEYLKRNGYNEEEVAQAFMLFDHRNILMLKDAMDYRAMESSKGKLLKKVKSLPRVQKPGVVEKKGKDDTLTANRDRLRRLKSRGTRQQQEEAATDYVKSLIGM